MLIQYSDTELVVEFQEKDKPDDFAFAVAQLSLWLGLKLDVRIAGVKVVVKTLRLGKL